MHFKISTSTIYILKDIYKLRIQKNWYYTQIISNKDIDKNYPATILSNSDLSDDMVIKRSRARQTSHF